MLAVRGAAVSRPGEGIGPPLSLEAVGDGAAVGHGALARLGEGDGGLTAETDVAAPPGDGDAPRDGSDDTEYLPLPATTIAA